MQTKVPKFEKRHFEYLADILKNINFANQQIESKSITTDFVKNINTIYIDYFANKLASTNDNFDMDKFKEACNA